MNTNFTLGEHEDFYQEVLLKFGKVKIKDIFKYLQADRLKLKCHIFLKLTEDDQVCMCVCVFNLKVVILTPCIAFYK